MNRTWQVVDKINVCKGVKEMDSIQIQGEDYSHNNIFPGTDAGDTAAFCAISNDSNLCTLSKKLEATGEGCTAKTSIPTLRTSIANDAANWETNALVAP